MISCCGTYLLLVLFLFVKVFEKPLAEISEGVFEYINEVKL